MNLTTDQINDLSGYISKNGTNFLRELAQLCKKLGVDEDYWSSIMATALEGMIAGLLAENAEDEVEILEYAKGTEKRIIDKACKFQDILKKSTQAA